MIQELLGGERNYSSINGEGVLLPTTQSPCSLPSSPCPTNSTTTATATATSSTSENQQNLRCPRCDSSNTKFCYYNNYNLTQPRHFCKTCRRYWTKGGALRNVPIGGGCRKNKNIIGVPNSVTKTTASKMKTVASEFGRPSGLGHGFKVEHELQFPPSSQILWGSPQNTHLLALLRASQNQNQNQSPNPNSVVGAVTVVKEEGNLMGSHSHMVTEPLVSNNGLFLNHRTPAGYDGVGQGHVLCSSFWRNNNQDQPQQQNGAFLLGEHQNSGIQELYHRLRSSSGNNYCSDTSPVFLGNVASSSSNSISNILEPTSVSGVELGYWNPTLSWSDLPTTNGAYP